MKYLRISKGNVLRQLKSKLGDKLRLSIKTVRVLFSKISKEYFSKEFLFLFIYETKQTVAAGWNQSGEFYARSNRCAVCQLYYTVIS